MSIDDHQLTALEEDDPTEKNFHIRHALQHRIIEEESRR